MIKTVEMDFQFMNYIDQPPVQPQDLMKRACSSDEITISSWSKQWIDQYTANHKKYGPFKDSSVGQLYGINAMKPAIICGSGPSLKNNIEVLAKHSKEMMVVSCLHNFHYMIDNNVDVDYYVTLDAGEVTVEEISEGGQKSHKHYVEKTKDKTLLAFAGTHPKLLESWKGKILFYNAPIPDEKIINAFKEVEVFDMHVGNGGNVLGACLYIAKSVMGSNPIIFTGADFCFSYKNTFHSWPSKYDEKLGNVVRATDVFGNCVRTWNSYFNFKNWFDFICLRVPGIWINASEGGCLGAYPEGNLRCIKQQTLESVFEEYLMYRKIEIQCKSPWDARDEKGQITLTF